MPLTPAQKVQATKEMKDSLEARYGAEAQVAKVSQVKALEERRAKVKEEKLAAAKELEAGVAEDPRGEVKVERAEKAINPKESLPPPKPALSAEEIRQKERAAKKSRKKKKVRGHAARLKKARSGQKPVQSK